MADAGDLVQLALDAGRVFLPGSPINERALFSGRMEQVRQIVDVVSQTGQHAIIFGERGVGKTSLCNVLAEFLSDASKAIVAPRVNCDSSDTYDTLWRKAFSDIELLIEREGIGFFPERRVERLSILDSLSSKILPDDVRKTLVRLSQDAMVVIIFDEFDRLPNTEIAKLMADSIKMLSDHAVRATLVLVGVGDSIEQLIAEHQSIERALTQIPMPRMSKAELQEIVETGLQKLNMSADVGAVDRITVLSQGLPYFTHLLSLEASRAALDSGVRTLSPAHVGAAINKAIAKSQHSIRNTYYVATKSPRKDNLFALVLLACALAKSDQFGFFTAANVRDAINLISGKTYDIPSFSRHLKVFCEDKRGKILSRSGDSHKVRFRFSDPLMQPFIILTGIRDGALTDDVLTRLLQTGQ